MIDGSAASARYRHEALAVRTHVRARWVTCPVAEVIEAVPSGGHLLDVGCGHGLLAFAASGRVDRITGVDPDADKIAVARRAVRRGERVDFRVGSIERISDEDVFDTVLVADVLYLVPEQEQRRWIERVAGRVRPGGTLVLKEMATTPRWKLQWVRAQETVATRMVGVTLGGASGLTFRSPTDVGAWLSTAGFEVTHRRVDRRMPWPHHLTVAVRSTHGPLEGQSSDPSRR